MAAYARSFAGAFVFDDVPAIVENPTLRWHGWRGMWAVLFPPGAEAGTVGGRPLVNLSLALNYAAGGLAPAGYHAVNLTIHVLAGLTLWGIVRRTLAGREWLAWSVAAIWLVHPLQTEAVTYVVQRAESLMGLFYFFTLYAFIRGWLGVSVAACLAGMMTKEVMVTAPVMVLLYDRTWVGGSFTAALKVRWKYYAGLAATGVVLATLMLGTGGRGGSAGFGQGVAVGSYVLTQIWAVARYLRLAVWPMPLAFDYGLSLRGSLGAVWPQAILLAGLMGGTVWALVRRPALGFVGAWFFVILAPTSTVMPIVTEPVAEHRMYLPLAAVIVAGALAAGWAGQRVLGKGLGHGGRVGDNALHPLVFVFIAAGIIGTEVRNRDYRTPLALWSATVRTVPENARAQNNLGQIESAAGDGTAAIREFSAALASDPGYVPAHFNLGTLLLDSGHPDQAEPHLRTALRGPRHVAEAHLRLAEAIEQQGRAREASEEYHASLELDLANAEAAFGWGNTLAAQNRFADAAVAFRRAAQLAPAKAEPWSNLGTALLYAGDARAAIAAYQQALRLKPHDPAIEANLQEAIRMLRTKSGP